MLRLPTALVVLLSAVGLPALAGADPVAAPQPGCAGLNFSDPRDDSPRADTDLLDGFLALRDDVVTYSVRVDSLPAGKAPGLFGVSRFYVHYDVGSQSQYVVATVRTDDARFVHGHDGEPVTPSSGSVHRGTPAVISFVLPAEPTANIEVERIFAAPGVDLPDDDVATGSAQSATCPEPPPAAEPPPAEPRAPSTVVGLRDWRRGLIVTVRPARPGRVSILRGGRQVKTALVAGARTRVRLRTRRGVYRARFRADDGGPAQTSAPLRIGTAG